MVYAPQPNSYRCELGGETPSECAKRCAQAIEDLILFHGPSTVAAVLAETITSTPIIPGDEYWPMLRQICDRYGVVLIADEVINGFGRTGKMFAMEHFGVVPDIMTMAKGITSSYLPLANVIVTPQISDAFAGGDNIFRQALTFGGHPVTAAVALANIEIIEKEGLVENSEKVGAYFLEQLNSLKEDHKMIGDVRGIGLLVGMEFVKDRETKASFPAEANLGEKLTAAFREEKLLLMGGNGRTVGMGPPLCMTPSDVDDVVARLDRALGNVEKTLKIS
jgi:adenosylmethionine-8-amino-7-oxononanoate aminotransferase